MHVPGGHTGGATPVPIPNTEVKPSKADATAAVRPWESRTLPGYKKACWSKIQQAFSFSSIECEGEPGHPLCSPNAHARSIVFLERRCSSKRARWGLTRLSSQENEMRSPAAKPTPAGF